MPNNQQTVEGKGAATKSREEWMTIETMVAELQAAGWTQVSRTVWKAPGGGYFLGPYGAWKAMKLRREEQS